MKKLYFIVPIFNDSITGGTLYDFNLIKHLKKKFIRVVLKSVKHDISCLQINRLIKSIPSQSKVIIDGYLSHKISHSLHTRDIWLLIHHPCMLEDNDYVMSNIKLFFKEKKSYNNVKSIITVSKTIRETVKKLSKIKKKISIAYPGVDKKYFNIDNSKATNDIISIGNVIPRKGYGNLIEAFKNITGDWRLFIIGDTSINQGYYQHLKDKIKKYKLESKVNFVGKIFEDEIITYISNSKIFVSSTRYEGFGMSIMECASAGLDIIITDLPVLREVFRGLSVTYVKKDNVECLREAIKSRLNIHKTNYNRKLIKKYNWNRTAQQVMRAIYE